MNKARIWWSAGAVGISIAFAATTGCQTWVGGMTLPSGHYLQHEPQFFPPSPAFPLTRELAGQEAAAAAAPGEPAPPGALPPPVVQPLAPVPPGVPPAPPQAAPVPPPER